MLWFKLSKPELIQSLHTETRNHVLVKAEVFLLSLGAGMTCAGLLKSSNLDFIHLEQSGISFTAASPDEGSKCSPFSKWKQWGWQMDARKS